MKVVENILLASGIDLTGVSRTVEKKPSTDKLITSLHGTYKGKNIIFVKKRGIFVTIETEGSHFLETDFPIALISLSPKFSNSIPKFGV